MVNGSLQVSEDCAGISRGILRIVETTDLHMQIMPHDYFTETPDLSAGLVQLADQIDALRTDPAVLTLLFDNGDFLQGNPLADTVAQAGPQGAVHPMMVAFSALRYDAVALGNHEFNYGLPFLRATLKDAPFPVLCANIDWQDEPACAQPYALLDRMLRCDHGKDHPIRIGVVGFVPPQVTQWDSVTLAGAIVTSDIVEAARLVVPRIKAAGADIIIALCHAGIGASEHSPGMENAAVPLAAVPGIDVILTGHTHDVFPDPARAPSPHVDPVAGRLHGKPSVGAGFNGKALGMITLDLQHDADGWQITDHHCRIIPATGRPAQSAVSRQITAAVQADHQAALHRLRQPVVRTAVPIHSFFARVSPDLPGQILGAALISHAGDVLPDLDLPVIAAVSPFRAGGLAGPGHYVDIRPGPVTLRDVSALYPYADTPVIVRRTGAELCDWLEQAVSGYHRIKPDVTGQLLLDPEFAAYVFDALFGLTYAIDLTRPPRHDATGRIITPDACRITDLCHNGRTVHPQDSFAVVVNSYRAFGGGGFRASPIRDVLALSPVPVREILADHMRGRQTIDAHLRNNWRFSPIAGASARFVSAPHARHHQTGAIRHDGIGADGFDRYTLAF